jgi:hypothetical protein
LDDRGSSISSNDDGSQSRDFGSMRMKKMIQDKIQEEEAAQ